MNMWNIGGIPPTRSRDLADGSKAGSGSETGRGNAVSLAEGADAVIDKHQSTVPLRHQVGVGPFMTQLGGCAKWPERNVSG